jgi:predicted N-acetyltransferase YhbS
MILVTISVLSAYQGKGIGSGLIRWGTSIADKEGVYSWVHTSDNGRLAFQKMGFREVRKLEVELDDFAGTMWNEEREDERWGRYIFRYMRHDDTLER